MEEKKAIKINLSTFFLVFAIIVIIIMGIFMYKIYNEKTMAKEESLELKNQITKLNGTIDDLQEKIDKISETISPNNTEEKNNYIYN